jgi:predicted phosphodiesterase
MVTRDEVPHDRRLSGSITVTIDEVGTNPKSRRDAELSVRDEDGAELTVVIWETHEISQSWNEGATYVLTGARGKRYSTPSGTRVEVQSTKAFSAQQVSANNATHILVLGDTHVGYRHRSPSEKSAWAGKVNACEVFIRCLERARDLDVDAVVHAGDVFDHGNTQGDRNAVVQAISRTVGAGIPFYYVFGNHDDEKGRNLLTSTPGIHLTEATSPVGSSSVNLRGVDHSGQSFPTTAQGGPIDMLLAKTALVIHESPHPVVDRSGSLLYQNDPNRADILPYIESADFDIDLIVTGHLHVADRPRVRDHDIPVLVTGPTVPISSYEGDSNPSTWLLTATSSEINLERQPV